MQLTDALPRDAPLPETRLDDDHQILQFYKENNGVDMIQSLPMNARKKVEI